MLPIKLGAKASFPSVLRWALPPIQCSAQEAPEILEPAANARLKTNFTLLRILEEIH